MTPPTMLPTGEGSCTCVAAFGCGGGALYAEVVTGIVAARRARDTPSAPASVLLLARLAAKAAEESCDTIDDAVDEPSTVLSAAAAIAINASIENQR